MAILDNIDDKLFAELASQSTSLKQFAVKLGYAKNGNNENVIIKRCNELGISLEHFGKEPKHVIQWNPDILFVEKSQASQSTLRRWYIKGEYSEYRCAICGQEPFWNGKDLTLTLDHINGINNDNRLENLRWVCPNCDRQLDTFCSKNIKKQAQVKNYCVDCGKEIGPTAERCPKCAAKIQQKVDRPDKEQLRIEITTLGFTGTGRKYGVSDNAIRKWCKAYGMPTHMSDYKGK